MTYTRRTADEIYSLLASLVLSRSRLNDFVEGSVVAHIISAVALYAGTAEIAIERLRDAFFMENLSGSALDERARELPPEGMERVGAVAASGGVLSVSRESTAGAFTVRGGALVVENVEKSGALYQNTGDIVFADGERTKEGVAITALVAGERGNATINAIRAISNGPPEIVSATNAQPLNNGAESETDGDFLARIRLYFSSVARCLPTSLLFLARSHVSGSGERARFVDVWENPERRGEVELVVDDGSGTAGGVRSGATTTGVVSANGAKILHHEFPATAPIGRILVTRGGVQFAIRPHTGDFVSRYESGLVFLRDGVLEEGDTWEISTDTNGVQYEVYTGLVASLQATVEPDFSRAATRTGWRGAGIRVKVRPAVRQEVSFDVHVVPRGGVTLAVVAAQVEETAVSFLQSLAPGATLYESQLIGALDALADVLSVRIYRRGENTALGDQSPTDHFRSLRTSASAIRVIPQP